MMETQLSKGWLKKHGDKLKVVYSYAGVHNYDINSQADVLQILKVIDPDNVTEENAKLFSKMLQLFRIKFRKTIKKKLES